MPRRFYAETYQAVHGSLVGALGLCELSLEDILIGLLGPRARGGSGSGSRCGGRLGGHCVGVVAVQRGPKGKRGPIRVDKTIPPATMVGQEGREKRKGGEGFVGFIEDRRIWWTGRTRSSSRGQWPAGLKKKSGECATLVWALPPPAHQHSGPVATQWLPSGYTVARQGPFPNWGHGRRTPQGPSLGKKLGKLIREEKQSSLIDGSCRFVTSCLHGRWPFRKLPSALPNSLKLLWALQISSLYGTGNGLTCSGSTGSAPAQHV